MKIKQIKWINREGTEYGFIADIRLFAIFHDAITPRNEIKDNKYYIIGHNLPGFKTRIYVESIKEGKIKAEFLIVKFIEKMTEQER